MVQRLVRYQKRGWHYLGVTAIEQRHNVEEDAARERVTIHCKPWRVERSQAVQEILNRHEANQVCFVSAVDRTTGKNAVMRAPPC